MRIESAAFRANGRIPKRHAGEAEDVSPPLSWSGAPEGARAFALICDDPDAPRQTPWVHWLLWNVAAGATSLPEGARGVGSEGTNDFGQRGWGGPMPPQGHGVHHYHFRLYALDRTLDLRAGADKPALLEAMRGHVLAEAELIGTYERP